MDHFAGFCATTRVLRTVFGDMWSGRNDEPRLCSKVRLIVFELSVFRIRTSLVNEAERVAKSECRDGDECMKAQSLCRSGLLCLIIRRTVRLSTPGPSRRRNHRVLILTGAARNGGEMMVGRRKHVSSTLFSSQIGYQEDRIRCSQLVFIDCTCGANPVCWRDTIIQALYWITYQGSWRQLLCNCHDILNMQPDFRSIGPFGAGTIETRYELSWRVEEKWVIGCPRSVLISNTGSAGS
ncbi:unnamed protein product, partial [Aureobasidium pullulans]